MTSLNTLLDRVYELEGLIHLALSRGDNPPSRISELILTKGSAVREALENYEKSVNVNIVAEDHESIIEAEELKAYSLEEEAQESSDKISSYESDYIPESECIDELNTEDSHISEEGADEKPSSEDSEEEVVDESATVLEKSETAEDEKEIAESAEEEERGLAFGPAPVSRNLRTLFSINDRFRFSRELFGGSTRRFDDSLIYLDGAIDFNEVEDFFIVDQGFDAESPVVQEFLEVLSRGFAD